MCILCCRRLEITDIVHLKGCWDNFAGALNEVKGTGMHLCARVALDVVGVGSNAELPWYSGRSTASRWKKHGQQVVRL